MSRADFEAAYIERYGHRPRGWNDDFQVYQDAHANGAWFGWQAGAAGIEAKAAPVGEREAQRAAIDAEFLPLPYDADQRDIDRRNRVELPCFARGFQAGAAYQRQSGVVPELAECWKLADQLANGSHFDSVPNHDDDSLYDLIGCGDPRRLRLQAERADDLAKMLAKLLARLNGAGSHE